MLVVMIYSRKAFVTYTCVARLGVLLFDFQDSLHYGHRKQQVASLLYMVSIEVVRLGPVSKVGLQWRSTSCSARWGKQYDHNFRVRRIYLRTWRQVSC
jgi:hypothetical protein